MSFTIDCSCFDTPCWHEVFKSCCDCCSSTTPTSFVCACPPPDPSWPAPSPGGPTSMVMTCPTDPGITCTGSCYYNWDGSAWVAAAGNETACTSSGGPSPEYWYNNFNRFIAKRIKVIKPTGSIPML